MEPMWLHWLYGLLTVVLLDLVLAGDNAIVIALAARALPAQIQKKAMLWGVLGAVAVRLLMTIAVVYLLKVPGLMLAGGLLLLPIAWKLLTQAEHAPSTEAATSFWGALRTIVVADALMGLDNVLAIAGASGGQPALVIVGLLVSVPLVVAGSTLILKLIERLPLLVYVGAAAIVVTAVRMVCDDPLVAAHLKSWWSGMHYVLMALMILLICGGGWWRRRTVATA
ncbi:YjbE family putative metal transport protein [Frateuria aurantia]|uniref:Integral membrane protein, YjbE family n=1 Tax=Frateuria aurantia (strain ATCC 33424 / DSM 6220 / KCTC 2777 / LMG 1558 / NBRC 3245 / NCIMB 13370) TaxID=767434 RepID=H8L426_FRAAD|nr:YjbE family putative metal transport protein [Frateuria aurantia]AFC85621.1 integral membrane protein, YjbE family [Frateuria aurantia DSM 6220]